MAHILLDLDGTLADTLGDEFDDIRSGRHRAFRVEDVPLLPGALDFVDDVKRQGHSVSIISDSHGAYVEKLAGQRFKVPCLPLADKPNTAKLRNFLRETCGFPDVARPDDFLMVGDSSLDVHLARGLSIPSVCLDLNVADPGDGRAFWHATAMRLKYGSTYYCRSYKEILDVLISPEAKRLVLEDAAGLESMRILNARNENGGITMYRALARQNQGPCDRYGALQRYYEFQSERRNGKFLQQISHDVSRYLRGVVCAHPGRFSWDYITCVADKETTKPPRKMTDFLHSLDISIPKVELFSWSSKVEGTIRSRPTTADRRRFVDEFASLRTEANLDGRNIIVLDDQYTTGATADSHVEKLISAGARNVMFLALFYLVSDVPSERECPRCRKIARIKFRKSDGRAFYSCVPPEYNGSGCGWMEWKANNEAA